MKLTDIDDFWNREPWSGEAGRGNVKVVVTCGPVPEDVYKYRFGSVEAAVGFLALVLRKQAPLDLLRAKIKADTVRVDACVAALSEKDAADVLYVLRT